MSGVLDHSSRRSRYLRARVGTVKGAKFSNNGKCELIANFKATKKGETGSVKEKLERLEFSIIGKSDFLSPIGFFFDIFG